MAKAQLLALLEVPEGQRLSQLELLRKGPTTISGPSVLSALSQYSTLRSLEISKLNFTDLLSYNCVTWLAMRDGFSEVYFSNARGAKACSTDSSSKRKKLLLWMTPLMYSTS